MSLSTPSIVAGIAAGPAGSQIHRAMQRRHAFVRYHERYGADLPGHAYAALCDVLWAAIYGNGSSGAIRVPGNVDRYMVSLGSILCIAVWDQRTMQIATFLPLSNPWPLVTDEGVR